MTSTAPPDPEQRVVIVDDHLMCAETLELALGMEGYDVARIEFPEGPSSTRSLVAALLRMHPHVVLLDLDLGAYGDGVPLIEPAANEGVDVVVLTGSLDPVLWADAVEAGARKVISKSRPLRDVISTVRRLMAGRPVMGRAEREHLLDLSQRQRSEDETTRARFDSLSIREAEVLGLLMLGHRVREIAADGSVAEVTVRTQVKQILSKLGVSSQLAAVGLAHQVGWQPAVTHRVRS